MAAAGSDLPVMIYLPGIDGTGLAAYRQFPSLSQAFQLTAMIVPPDDRSSFRELVDVSVTFVEELVPSLRASVPVYLLGESFGALLALAVGARCPNIVDRIVLVNPATSYEGSIWPKVCA
jgi:pimeloyl-ACP methyl ester carboxylesterase